MVGNGDFELMTQASFRTSAVGAVPARVHSAPTSRVETGIIPGADPGRCPHVFVVNTSPKGVLAAPIVAIGDSYG